jgi:predicted extracellular nuclease
LKLFLRLLIVSLPLALGIITSALAGGTVSILSQNMNRLFDNVGNGSERVETTTRYRQRIKITAAKILQDYDSPDIIAFQEVENISVLRDIADRVRNSGGPDYRAFLLEGNDQSGIDVGYLVDVTLNVKQAGQLFKNTRFQPGQSPLFSRPPLLIEVCNQDCLTLVNVHLRSMRGLRSAKKGERVARKRIAQAEHLASWVDQFQDRNSDKFLLITGDLNALQPADKYTDIVGILIGNPDNTGKRYTGRDEIKNDLSNLIELIHPDRRFSYIYKGRKQVLDYMLASKNFSPRLRSIRFGSVDRNFSDHAGLLAEFNW